LLEEALESFLRQDYEGEKELIICNDFSEQTFVFQHPEVKIINTPIRCPNLGSKRNLAYSHATGDVFLTWGDDDIHLPGRISRMVNSLNQFKSGFVFEGPFYILYGGQLTRELGKTSGAHIVTKELFNTVGGIPEINSGEDQAFNARIREHIKKPLDVCTEPPQFLYRFSTGRAHVSQFGQDKENKKSGYDTMLDIAKTLIKGGQEPQGEYHLKPHWSKDWMVEASLAPLKKPL
jgi:glycosyltransferase involved in cell wall biosynthesis